MRLTLTVVAVGEDDPVDVAVDCEDDALVGGLAAELGDLLGVHSPALRPTAVGSPLAVVEAGGRLSAPPPSLWLGEQRLDPATPVREAGLLDGTVVGLGGGLPDVLAEPGGVVELRVVGGPGAGSVRRLSPGSWSIGAAEGSGLQVLDPGAPDTACWLDVTAAGELTLRPAPEVVGRTRPAPARTMPLDGPVLVPPATPRPDDRAGKDEQADPPATKRRRRGRRAAGEADAAEVDATDDVPLVHLDRAPLADVTSWVPGSLLGVGSVLVQAVLPTAPDAALEPSADGVGLDYNRPPRLLPPLRPTAFRLPTRPKEPNKRPFPVVMMLTPLLMSGVLIAVTGRWFYAVFGLLTPISFIGNAIFERRTGRATYRRQVEEYERRKEQIEADARAALVAEREARRADAPDPAEVLLTAVGPRARLWERRRDDPDHLALRVGTADLPSEVRLEDPEQLEHRRTVTWVAPDVPVTVPLAERGVLGIAGRGGLPRQLARWLVAQVAVLHSPADVQLYLLTESASAPDWSWVRWLPHVRPALGQDTTALLGTDADSVGRRIAELLALVQARQKAQRSGGGAGAGAARFSDPDVVVVLDGARRLRSLPGVITILREGPSVGVYAVCLDSDQRLLPEECSAVVLEQHDGLVVRQQRTDVVEVVRPDLVSSAWCERVARALAPVRDVGDVEEASTIPTSSRLLDVLGVEPPTGELIAARWTVSGRSTEVLVGESFDGPFAIDLRRDGPHGLVAGTTGAGKSELLQTIVASLAVANRPDAMTFVLVDYKGGSAFKDCVDLPHTVGMVTDLDTHLVERALESLGAELRRREHMLAEAGAKDIEDYTDLLPRRPGLEAMPRLLLVIDEFASMARELPDFVTGLVNIAQRGRSLGIHLILATQRPSGVVSPEIRANTNLRIALRVTDTVESTDVIEAPDAARIAKSTPGRAYVRLGHASLVPFQAGRVGGRRPGTTSTTPASRPWVVELTWPRLGQPLPPRPVQRVEDDAEVTDLKVLVDAVRAADERLAIPPQHSPWLPALPDAVLLDALPAPGAVPAGRLAPVAYALEDLPGQQARRPAVLDPATFGHLYVIGSPRSGRSQVLRTIAGALTRTHSAADVHVYGIDCGNGALLPLAALPTCGAVVQRTQVERAVRLVTRLGAELDRRQALLAERGFADVTEQRAGSAEAERLPHVLVLLDRWEGWTSTLGEVEGGRLTDAVLRILREGASAGIHLVIAGDRSLLSGRMSVLTEDKLVLRLADKTDASLAGLNPRKIPDEMAPGRGFRSEGGVEMQVALLARDASGQGQAAALAAIASEAKERDRAVPRDRRPFRVDVLPSLLRFADAWQLRADDADRPLWGLVGVGGDELTPLGPDLGAGTPTFVVGGPPKSGRSSVLLSMTRSFLAGGAAVLVVAPRPSPLRDLAGAEGVLGVVTAPDLLDDDLAPLLAAEGPAVLVVDDAELLRDCSAKDALRELVRHAGDAGRGVVLGGNAEDVCGGFSGWQVEVKKGRQGALVCPQNLTDGDLIGVRLSRSSVGAPVQPGRAMLHLGDGAVTTVQVPMP